MRVPYFLFISMAACVAQSPVVPVVETRIANIDESISEGSRTIPLAFGTEEIRDEAVRLTATYDKSGESISADFDFLLFKTKAQNTVNNFLGYVDRGDYLDTIIHRKVNNFVIQGGGFKVAGDTFRLFPPIAVQAPIVNEFNVSNTLGTISMAKTAVSPDTATSQWFVSTANNSDNLDLQNGGFTVFARISKSTLPNALLVGNTSAFFPANFGGAQGALPLEAGSTPQTLNKEDFYAFDSVTRIPLPDGEAGTDTNLVYRVAIGNGANSIAGEIVGNNFNITYTDTSPGDTKIFTLEAEDSVGNIVQDTFQIQMVQTYEDWKNLSFSAEDAANLSISGPLADTNEDRVNNLQIYAFGLGFEPSDRNFLNITSNGQSITLSHSKRKFIDDTATFSIESSINFDDWTPITSNIRILTGSNIDTVTHQVTRPANVPKTFYRVRVTQN